MITTQSSDAELMTAYESLRAQACGEELGATDMTPAQAVESAGWTLIRAIHGGTNCPGTPVLAQDAADRLWVVNDLDGPWAIQVADPDELTAEEIEEAIAIADADDTMPIREYDAARRSMAERAKRKP